MKKIIRTKDGFRVTNINRRRACRLMCLECMGWEDADKEVDVCNGEMLDGSICALVNFKDMSGKQNPAKRDRAIRNFCLECMGDDTHAVSNCSSKFCPVYAYRSSTIDSSFLFDPDLDDESISRIGLNIL